MWMFVIKCCIGAMFTSIPVCVCVRVCVWAWFDIYIYICPPVSERARERGIVLLTE